MCIITTGHKAAKTTGGKIGQDVMWTHGCLHFRLSNDKKRGGAMRGRRTPPITAVVRRGWCEVSCRRSRVPPRLKTSELCTNRSALAVATVVESNTLPQSANGKVVVITGDVR